MNSENQFNFLKITIKLTKKLFIYLFLIDKKQARTMIYNILKTIKNVFEIKKIIENIEHK